MILDKIIVGPLQANCYILGCPRTSRAVVIDPGAEAERIKQRLKKYGLKLDCIINTHGHADHIGANTALAAPVYIHRLDAGFFNNPQLNLSIMFDLPVIVLAAAKLLEDGQKLKVGTISLEVIHTPGHTPGGICLNAGECIFTGDTLFAQGIGRTNLTYGSEKDLLKSIRERLLPLPDNLVIYPGHGPSSTIGEERKVNAFLMKPRLTERKRT